MGDWSGWMDTPQTVMTTKTPAVQKTLTNQVYVDQRPVYNMVSLRLALEPKGEIREISLESQKCICTFLPHSCGAEQRVSLAIVLRNMSRPPSRPALTRAHCLLCSDQSDDIWIITNLKTTTALNSLVIRLAAVLACHL